MYFPLAAPGDLPNRENQSDHDFLHMAGCGRRNAGCTDCESAGRGAGRQSAELPVVGWANDLLAWPLRCSLRGQGPVDF